MKKFKVKMIMQGKEISFTYTAKDDFDIHGLREVIESGCLKFKVFKEAGLIINRDHIQCVSLEPLTPTPES